MITIIHFSFHSWILLLSVVQSISFLPVVALAQDFTLTLKNDYSCDLYTDSCDQQRNGNCDSQHGNPQLSQSDSCYDADCFDCDALCRAYAGDCTGCLENGCYWCPGDATCFNSPFYLFNVQNSCFPSDYKLLVDTTSATATFEDQCTSPTNPSFNDPLYEAQKWVWDMLQVQPVWDQGYTGAGIRVRINDNGVEMDHAEFEGRFDVSGSCDNFLPYSFDQSRSRSHGTSVASIVGADWKNGKCGVGVAPGVSLTACNLASEQNPTALLTGGYYLSTKLDQMDISQNSYGNPSCEAQITSPMGNGGRDLQAGTCPFVYRPPPKNFGGTFQSDPFPCDACDFTAAPRESQQCLSIIIQHCSKYYKRDKVGCIEFLDLVLQDGTCEYNRLLSSQRDAIIEGITEGRNGKGILYVFASGNDFDTGANVNFHGFLNTRFTITVGAVGRSGRHTSYSTPGAALMVTAPGGDGDFISNMVMAGRDNSCIVNGVGTSYAAPVVSGVLALVLEANPDLTWRDIQGILAETSNPVFANSGYDQFDIDWVRNSAGIYHSYYYGFGIIYAANAVEAAKTWTPFGPEQFLTVSSGILEIPIPDDETSPVLSTVLFASSAMADSISVDYFIIESVVVYAEIDHPSRGDLNIILTAPSGTTSILHPGNRPETGSEERWKFLTVRNWGESALGSWTLSVADISRGTVGVDAVPADGSASLVEWQLILYGREELPPTGSPSSSPSMRPSSLPSISPTFTPTVTTNVPTVQTSSPTELTSIPTMATALPSFHPTTFAPSTFVNTTSNTTLESDPPSLSPSNNNNSTGTAENTPSPTPVNETGQPTPSVGQQLSQTPTFSPSIREQSNAPSPTRIGATAPPSESERSAADSDAPIEAVNERETGIPNPFIQKKSAGQVGSGVIMTVVTTTVVAVLLGAGY